MLFLFIYRPRPAACHRKACAFSKDDEQCDKMALPYTKFCKDRIFSATDRGHATYLMKSL